MDNSVYLLFTFKALSNFLEAFCTKQEYEYVLHSVGIIKNRLEEACCAPWRRVESTKEKRLIIRPHLMSDFTRDPWKT